MLFTGAVGPSVGKAQVFRPFIRYLRSKLGREDKVLCGPAPGSIQLIRWRSDRPGAVLCQCCHGDKAASYSEQQDKRKDRAHKLAGFCCDIRSER